MLGPGKLLNELVFQNVYKVAPGECSTDNVSDDLYAANDLLLFLGVRGFQIRMSNKAQGANYWWVYLTGPEAQEGTAQGSTWQHALCLAALQAYGVNL